MKNIITLLFLVPLLSIGQTTLKTHTTKLYEVKYPSTWTLDESGKMGAVLFLFTPLEGTSDKFSENINLLIQDVAAYKLDLDGYTKLSEDQVKKMIPNSKMIESRRIKTGNGEHHKLVYTGDQKGVRLKFEQYYWVIKGKAYVLTLTTELNKFDAYKKVGEAVLDSFKLTV